jgi:hypothetical protein
MIAGRTGVFGWPVIQSELVWSIGSSAPPPPPRAAGNVALVEQRPECEQITTLEEVTLEGGRCDGTNLGLGRPAGRPSF